MTGNASRIGWLGLVGALGGILSVCNLVLMIIVPELYFRGAPLITYVYPLISALSCTVAVAALAQRRPGRGRAESAGFLFLAFSTFAALSIELSGLNWATMRLNPYHLAVVFPAACGFLLISLRSAGAVRLTSAAAALLGFVWFSVPNAIPVMTLNNRGFMPVGVAYVFMVATALAVIGHDVFRRSHPVPNL